MAANEPIDSELKEKKEGKEKGGGGEGGTPVYPFKGLSI